VKNMNHHPESEPVVSIVINNYNYGRYLRAAIESALNQTTHQVEVIVVDDGSTDQSRDVIRDYGDRIIAVFKDNGGQASAMNAGFARSHGDIIIFLDADDILLTETAQRVVEAFRADETLAKVQYRMEVIDAEGRRTGNLKPASYLPLQSGDLRRHHLEFPFDLVRMATSGNAFPVRVLRQIFPIPEPNYGNSGADWYICYVAPLFGPVGFLEELGAFYRVHGSNKFEPAAAILNLDTIRQAIVCADITRPYIEQYADHLHLNRRPGEILSVSDVANRMISLKLNANQHPLPDDKLWRLLWMGLRAPLRRFDIAWPMKGLFIGWFISMVLAPKPLAHWLAEVFSFPARRDQINRFLRTWHVNSRERSSAQR
jgi:hypothetical protein